jgi:hypothetical protein
LITDDEAEAEYNSTYRCDAVELDNAQDTAEFLVQSCSYSGRSSSSDINVNNISSNQHIPKDLHWTVQVVQLW